jgi:hypothetical protein
MRVQGTAGRGARWYGSTPEVLRGLTGDDYPRYAPKPRPACISPWGIIRAERHPLTVICPECNEDSCACVSANVCDVSADVRDSQALVLALR